MRPAWSTRPHTRPTPPLYLSPADGLWWLGSGRAVTALRRLLLLASLAVFLAALEERVVFHSFNQYIRLTAPWNYVAVTGELQQAARCLWESSSGQAAVRGWQSSREAGWGGRGRAPASCRRRWQEATLSGGQAAGWLWQRWQHGAGTRACPPPPTTHPSLPPPSVRAACMYGVAALVLLHVGGSLGEELEGLLVGPLLMLSAAVGALAGGLPMWMLPAPLLAASGLAMFYDTRALRDYLLFVVGSLATGERCLPAHSLACLLLAGLAVVSRCRQQTYGPSATRAHCLPSLLPRAYLIARSGGWFLWHHFWFLDIELDGMHLRVLCALVLAAMLPAALLPGLLYSGALSAGVLQGSGRNQGCLCCADIVCASRGKSQLCQTGNPCNKLAVPTPADSPKAAVSGMLLVQAALVAVLEEHLYWWGGVVHWCGREPEQPRQERKCCVCLHRRLVSLVCPYTRQRATLTPGTLPDSAPSLLQRQPRGGHLQRAFNVPSLAHHGHQR